jgi:uncharacterized LabA/DUF88 family protein
VNVCIDGFNLYYRKLDDSAFKWLNIRKLSELLVPSAYVKRVRYFTARVQPEPGNVNSAQIARQHTYIRALDTLRPQGVTLHFGLFKTQIKQRRRASPPHNLVSIIHHEEKGSDVNLASHLLLDAFNGDFDEALVISNDSDLRTPVQIVRGTLHRRVRVAIPGTHAEIPNSVIPADTYTRVSDAKLAASQFPTSLKDAHGTITKPAEW